MHPADCPFWEYTNHVDHSSVICARVSSILQDLRLGTTDSCQVAVDPRPTHYTMFQNLTPPGYDYYAGHYRGEGYRCLQYCNVRVNGDPSVGFSAGFVIDSMEMFEQRVRRGVAELDLTAQLPDSVFSSEQKLLKTVLLACHAFVTFLQIHPFVNGNGHMGRFIIWAILGRYGYWPSRWPVEPRPPDPPYTSNIVQFRQGNHGPLVRYILACLAG